MDQQQRAALAERGMLAAVVAAISAANPPLGVVVSAGAPALEHALNRWRKDQGRRAARAITAASEESGLTADELITQLARNEHTLALLAEVVNAAANTAMTAKVEALGRSLGILAADDARIDPESLWIRIFRDLEPPHVRVLLELQREDSERPDIVPLQSATPHQHHRNRFSSCSDPSHAGVSWLGAPD